ncbi:MAG: hypothetical protein ACI8XB_002108 [Patiriisocius sp.]|jgi:hypothetical protein
MKKTVLILAIVLLIAQTAQPFCGFYVAKASSSLFNNKSQVILVRDGNLNTITMSNDFKGDVDQFAMVVPVPVILDREDIKVVSRGLFDRLDAYSAPRMVEYYDSNPCEVAEYELMEDAVSIGFMDNVAPISKSAVRKNKEYGVTIEAKYNVEEYDILILSATKSTGLQEWLEINGYKIPEKAQEVLKPYIKNKMKFFVVKVDTKKIKGNTEYLRPLQISYHHDRFMLPIRLGMANSTGEQDMLVYAMSKKGRIECANYRTVKMPTDRNIPKFILDRSQFGDFYKDAFEKAYDKEGKNAVFLEYAWNVSPQSGMMKCDPCVAPAPHWVDFQESGVKWINQRSMGGSVYFTRLHVRYSRDQFPQDLLFLETPNKENFQARYVIHHPAYGDLSCDAGQDYLQDLKSRRKLEVDELRALTGWDKKSYGYYVHQYTVDIEDENVVPVFWKGVSDGPMTMILASIFMLSLLLTAIWFVRVNQRRELA